MIDFDTNLQAEFLTRRVHEVLTPKQADVFLLMADGETAKEVAARYHVSESAIYATRSAAAAKMRRSLAA